MIEGSSGGVNRTRLISDDRITLGQPQVPKILTVRSVAKPSPLSRKRRKYDSPDGRWSLIYHSPREFHMGADGWRMQLWRSWLSVTARHASLSRLAGADGFRCESDLQPWSHDSKVLVVMTWDVQSAVHSYELETKTVRNIDCGGKLPVSVKWSPTTDRLLVTLPTVGVLWDQAVNRRGTAHWSIAPHETPHTGWMRDGQLFFALARESVRSKTMLTFYRGDDGARGESLEVDPGDLAPYQAQEFAALARDTPSLVIPPGARGEGSLLDVWHSMQFDHASDTLYLGTYRPVSAVYRDVGGLQCDVEERWVAVELGE